MIEIIAGIFIGMTIETFGLSMYFVYKRNINKPNIKYSNQSDVEYSENLNENISTLRESVNYTDL